MVLWCRVGLPLQIFWDFYGWSIRELVWNTRIQAKSTEHFKHALGARTHVCGIQNRNLENFNLSFLLTEFLRHKECERWSVHEYGIYISPAIVRGVQNLELNEFWIILYANVIILFFFFFFFFLLIILYANVLTSQPCMWLAKLFYCKSLFGGLHLWQFLWDPLDYIVQADIQQLSHVSVLFIDESFISSGFKHVILCRQWCLKNSITQPISFRLGWWGINLFKLD